jgi:lipopolysaccharide transport system ATP-binding protein
MKARLGFSVSVHIDADILLIDEVLSVGDMSFQRKCLKRMEEYINNETSIIFVSHNLESIRKLCKRTILFDKGKIVFDGNTEEAISKYFEAISQAQLLHDSNQVYDNGCEKLAGITDIQLLKDDGSRLLSFSFKTGDKAIFQYSVVFTDSLNDDDRKYADIGFFVRRSDRLKVIDTSTGLLKTEINELKTESKWTVEFAFEVNLLTGSYNIGTYIGDRRTGKIWDYIDKSIDFYVSEDICYEGVADLKIQCLISAGKANTK